MTLHFIFGRSNFTGTLEAGRDFPQARSARKPPINIFKFDVYLFWDVGVWLCYSNAINKTPILLQVKKYLTGSNNLQAWGHFGKKIYLSFLALRVGVPFWCHKICLSLFVLLYYVNSGLSIICFLNVHNSIAVEIFKIFLQIYKDCHRSLERYKLERYREVTE